MENKKKVDAIIKKAFEIQKRNKSKDIMTKELLNYSKKVLRGEVDYEN